MIACATADNGPVQTPILLLLAYQSCSMQNTIHSIKLKTYSNRLQHAVLYISFLMHECGLVGYLNSYKSGGTGCGSSHLFREIGLCGGALDGEGRNVVCCRRFLSASETAHMFLPCLPSQPELCIEPAEPAPSPVLTL